MVVYNEYCHILEQLRIFTLARQLIGKGKLALIMFKPNFKFISIILIPILFWSCKKEELKASDYLIFGSFYGMCQGEQCIETFKLTKDFLYEDRKDEYPDRTSFFNGDFEKLDKKFLNNLELDIVDLPKELLETESGKVFGCPDCADGGGLFIEYKSGKTHKFWVIDNMKYQVPEYLHPFMDQVRAEIQKINE